MRRTLIPLLAVVAVLAVPAGATASSSQLTVFEAPRELLSDDAALRAQTFDEIEGFGVGWLRVVLYWRSVAPDADSARVPAFDEEDPATYPAAGFARYDRAIAEARARGLRVMLTVTGPVPRWATSGRRDNVTRPSPTRFRRFMEAVLRRYGDAVDHYAVWNEPNHPQFLGPQYDRDARGDAEFASARHYRRLFQAAEDAVDRVGKDDARLLLGETAPRGTRSVVPPRTFLRVALGLDADFDRRRGVGRLDAYAVAHHAYTTREGPFFVPRQPNDITLGSLGRLNALMARAERERVLPRGTDIWLTEFGIESRPDTVRGVSETQQAEFRSWGERIAQRNPRVRAFSQYLMRDDVEREGDTEGERWRGFQTGLRHADGEPKLAYEGFRLPLVAELGSRRTTLWGIVRPASGRTRVSIDYRNPGSSRWRFLKRDTTNGRGAWTTTTSRRSGRSYRVRWTGPDGRRHEGPRTRAYRD
jgi:hypothetical protein